MASISSGVSSGKLVAGLSDEERRYEETLKTLKAQLAEAIKANDAVVQQSLLAQIAAETQRHEQAMANLEAERKAKEDTSGATSTNTSASTSTSSTGTASTSSGTTASTGASRGTGGNTVNFNIDGVLDISDRGTLDTLARRLRPILAELERKGVV